ncbi:MAG: ABC transporter substrate-binding protein [Alphaproteobacteria bacterium]|nr:ABC transporter substrate-binding protein [Alphaproteobacteria bacterium]
MKKLILSLCMVLALTACDNKKEETQEKPVVKIGVILPLTGSNAFMGEQMRQGYEFVQEYQHPDISYELIYFDDQQSASKAVAGVKKLIEIDKVNALLTGTSQTASVVADAVKQAKIIHLGISSDIRFTQKDYNYTMAPKMKDEATVLLGYMNEHGYDSIAMISANEMYANLVEENISQLVGEYGMRLTFNEKFTPRASNDYRLLLRMAAQTAPDIFFIQTFPPEIDILTRQLLEIVPDAKITTSYAFFISSNPELYKGRFALNIGSKDEVFKKAFRQKYGKGLEQMSAAAYAQLSLMLDVLRYPNDDFEKAVNENKSIFGKLTLENHSVRYLPIVEILE